MPAPWGLEPPGFPGRMPTPPLPIEDRAITLSQLRDLSQFIQRLCKVGLVKFAHNSFNERLGRAGHHIKWSQITMHEITADVIKKVIPETSSCSWVELVGRGCKQTRTYFCSHNWGESFRDFVATINHHSREFKVRPDETYWICVFANNQWKVELGETLGQSPFFEALRGSRMTVVMMDKVSEVLRRLWCVFEMHETCKLKQGFEFWTPLGRVGSALVSSGPALRALENMDVRKAQASDEVDQRRIINYIAGVDELSGIDLASGGDKQLAPAHPPGVYEETIIDTEVAKFTELNQAILDASAGALSAQFSKSPLLPSWDEAGMPIDLSDQIAPTWICNGEDRGMSLGQLRAFAEMVRNTVGMHKLMFSHAECMPEPHRIVWDDPQGAAGQVQASLYHLHSHFVKPMTKPGKCSYAELVANAPQPCEHFVSHYWGTEFKSTIAALEWHAEARCMPDTTIYWICLFGIRQWSVEEDIPDDLRQSPFYIALHMASGVVVVQEDGAAGRLSNVFQRIWCIFEAWVATRSGKSYDLSMSSGSIATTKPFADGGWEFGSFNADVAKHLLSFAGQKGQSCVEKDRVRILNLIARRGLDEKPLEEHPSYDRLNNRMHERAAGPVLRKAAREGDAAQIREVIRQCPGLLLSSDSLRGSLGETPVHAAAGAGQLKALRLLLEHKASANDQDHAGESPLHYAAFAGQAVAAWELYRSGADVDLVSFAGETALDVAWQRPTFFCGIDTTAVADALMAASEDGGEAARQEYEALRADDAFMREHLIGRCKLGALVEKPPNAA